MAKLRHAKLRIAKLNTCTISSHFGLDVRCPGAPVVSRKCVFHCKPLAGTHGRDPRLSIQCISDCISYSYKHFPPTINGYGYESYESYE